MVSGFPLDYMHSVCLGVVKRLINIWLKGSLKFRIGGNASKEISSLLFNLRHNIPSEFSRKPRGFSELDRWKATEYRQFLLYTGPVVLKQIIDETLYSNFLLLSVSMHILLNSFLVEQYHDYAHQLLISFVQHFGQLYGSDQLVYNVHGLVHLSADAEKFVSLEQISAFPFENFLMTLKKMVRKPSFPLQQVIRRLSEHNTVECQGFRNHLYNNHFDGPLPQDFNGFKQHRSIKTEKFRYGTKQCDRFVRVDDKICQIENILSKDDDVFIVYKVFCSEYNFFETPLPSELLGIHTVSNLDNRIQVRPISDIQSKYILLPFKNDYVAMPFTDSIWTDFSVVEFKDTYEVAVVPSLWLVGKESSQWPTWKSISRTEKVVRQLEHPDETFDSHSIRIMYQTDSYQKAKEKLKKAEMMSDLQTEDEPDNQTGDKRIRRPTSRYQSIQTDSSESDASPLKRNSADLSSDKVTKSKATKKSYPPLPSMPAFPQISLRPSPQISPRPTFLQSPVASTSKRQCLQEQPAGSSTSRPVTAVEKKILTVLEELKGTVSHNTKLLNLLVKKTETTTEELLGIELPNGVSLPLSSVEQFEATEELLQNEAIAKKLTCHLGTIGGDSVGDCGRRTMKYIMTNQLAVHFNWKGKGEKKAFITSRILLVIRRAVRKNRLTAMASDNDIDCIIKDWLRFAKDREGGRKKRAMEKRRRETVDEAE